MADSPRCRWQLRPADNDRWTIWDEDDRPVFTGGLHECEDWLDLRENRARTAGWLAWLWRLWDQL